MFSVVGMNKTKRVSSIASQQCQWKEGAVETATPALTLPLVAPVREGGRLSTSGSLPNQLDLKQS